MNAVAALVRRIRVGQPIVVVSGLPRSGTSLAMKMLEVGGMPLVTDGVRAADVSNPNGYYEFEPVKELDKTPNPAWLADARGKAVKIVSFLLTWLPESYDYRVIFMQRPLDEVMTSQDTMLKRLGAPAAADADPQARALFEDHLRQVDRFLERRRCFSVLRLDYRDVVARPEDAASRVAVFCGRSLDVRRMSAVADPALYRNRMPGVSHA